MKIKKSVTGLLVGLLYACTCTAQITDTATLRNYINANIVPNGTRSITATQLNTSLIGLLNVMGTAGRNIFGSSGRITGDRYLSGYSSPTSRYSLTFDSLNAFEVRARGNFGPINPAYTGMRLIMNNGAGVMSMNWQDASGNGGIGVSPGGVSLAAQQGLTDNRLFLDMDGNRLLLTNPTTSGTNLLFRLDRADGGITLYGYPNTTGKLLSTDAAGKIVLVDAPVASVPTLQQVTDAGAITTKSMTITSPSGGTLNIIAAGAAGASNVGLSAGGGQLNMLTQQGIPSIQFIKGVAPVDPFISSNNTSLGFRLDGSSINKTIIFQDGRVKGAAAVNNDEFVTLSQANSLIGAPQDLQQVTDAGNTTTNAIAVTGLSDNIPTSGGNMLLLYHGDGEGYIEEVNKPGEVFNPLNIRSSLLRVNSDLDGEGNATFSGFGSFGGYLEVGSGAATITGLGSGSFTSISSSGAITSGSSITSIQSSINTTLSSSGTDGIVGTTSSNNLSIRANNVEGIKVTTNGYVGIGGVIPVFSQFVLPTGKNIAWQNSGGAENSTIGADDNDNISITNGLGTRLRIDGTNGNVAINYAATAPTSTLTVNGSFAPGILTVTEGIVLDNDDHTVVINNTGPASLALQAAASCPGRLHVIKKVSASSGNNVTISVEGGGTIDSATSRVLTLQNSSIMVQSTGTEWVIIAAYAQSDVL